MMRLSAAFVLGLTFAAAGAPATPVAGIPLAIGAAGAISEAADATDPARAALRKGKYPWYDDVNDRARPVGLGPPRTKSSWWTSLMERVDRFFQGVGDVFARIFRWLRLPAIGLPGDAPAVLLTGVGVILLVAMIGILWKSAGLGRDADEATGPSVGTADRIARLPGELVASAMADPWVEAEERRRRGDYSGAIVALFAHQLIELDRLGLIRLATGSTGRRYVRSVADPRIREAIAETLGLFEQVYYGHKPLSEGRFEPAWRRALDLQPYLATAGRGSP